MTFTWLELLTGLTTIFSLVFAYMQWWANPNSPHKDVETLRWEFGLFLEGELKALEGFREQLTGVLVSLKPEDPAGTYVFRARDFGLNDQEKEVRKINFERRKAELQAQSGMSHPQ